MASKGRPRAFDRRQALLRAMELFWQKGYSGASLSDLTAAMGINAPSLYAAFGSKEALFREAVEIYGEVEGGEIWQAVEEGGTARASIENFLHSTAISFTRPGKPPGCLIVLGALNGADAGATVCDALRELRLQNVHALKQRLERAVAEGELPATVDCQAVASFYATVQQGMSIQARDGANRDTLMAIADGAMAAWDRLTAPAVSG